MNAALKTLLNRENKILQDRKSQLRLNLLVLAGGKPYIEERLTRFPYEPDASWDGNDATDAKGRKERAFLVNYAGRAARKINQYVFQTPPKQDGIDSTFAADVTKTRMTVQQFREQLSSMLTAAQWCWIGVDRAAASVDEQTGTVRPQTVAQREARGDRIFWQLWSPTAVKDWHFDEAGRLEWLITEEELESESDPFLEPKRTKVRTLWKRGAGIRYFITANKDGQGDPKVEERPFTLSAGVVPFVPAGNISAMPHWYDEAEMIQGALLNLESVHHENLFQMVYPQMVLPSDIKDEGHDGGTSKAGDAVRRVGMHYPIFESDQTKGLARYIVPPADGLKLIPDEIQRRKREFFDIVGLAMQNRESRQVESAEAKAWDHLDVAAVLAERAGLLEDIERKAIELSKALDSTFLVYQPSYSRQFDLSDVESDMKSVMGLDALNLPPLARRELMRASVQLLAKVVSVPADRLKGILDEIDTADMTGGLSAIATTAPPR